MAHSTSNPDGCRGVVTPSDYLYAATLRLQELFLQYECMFRSAVFDFWWDDTDEAWRFAVETIAGDLHAVVILDELTYLVKYGMVPEAEVLKALAGRPARMHIVVTGRDASPGLIELADIVTEMRAVKHPYDDGMRAQRGVEF